MIINYLRMFKNAGTRYGIVFNSDNTYSFTGKQQDREGYLFGFFSTFRHKGLNQEARDLYRELLSLQTAYDKSDQKNPDKYQSDAEALMEEYFKKKPTQNNHSFASYLLDEAKEQLGDSNPFSKYVKRPIVYCNNVVVYKATKKPVSEFETRGVLDGTPSAKYEKYLLANNGDTGVSTTKCPEIATSYAFRYAQENAWQSRVLVIDLAEQPFCFDIDETNNIRHRFALNGGQAQINVKGNIPWTKVIGWIECDFSSYDESKYATIKHSNNSYIGAHNQQEELSKAQNEILIAARNCSKMGVTTPLNPIPQKC